METIFKSDFKLKGNDKRKRPQIARQKTSHVVTVTSHSHSCSRERFSERCLNFYTKASLFIRNFISQMLAFHHRIKNIKNLDSDKKLSS